MMTTNHRERLDPVLIRPGRVNKTMELGLATKDMASQLLSIVYEHTDCDTVSEEEAVDDAMVKVLAADFANEMPELEFSPAQIMSILVEKRHSPRGVMRDLQQWIFKMREEKKKT
jgi:chaperone BCS1